LLGDRFHHLAGGDEAAIVAIGFDQQAVDALAANFAWLTKPPFLVTTCESADAAALSEAIGHASGVWLAGGNSSQELMELIQGTNLADQLLELRKRSGVIAASGSAAGLLSADASGLDLLPGFAIQAAEPQRHLIGVQLSDESAFIVQGRSVHALNRSPVSFQLAANDARPARTITLRPRRPVDYVELRRAAAGRAGTPYPPPELGVPEVKSGALVIVGGGGLPDEIARRFVELGGGAEGLFVVLPTAMPDPLPANSGDGFLKRHGVTNIVVLKAREQRELETPENLEILGKATALWFGGGRQWHFVDAYEGTKVGELFHDVLRRGGVIGGSSAGATILGDYLVRGAPAGSHIMMCEGYERALGFLPGVAIDQHFSQRKRFGDMTELMQAYPQFLGIGIDEATALVVQGHVAEIMGQGSVHFYDRRKPLVAEQPDYDSVPSGRKYDLKERSVVPMNASP
jgi:cyanophycinase